MTGKYGPIGFENRVETANADEKLNYPDLPGLFHGKDRLFLFGGKLVKLRTNNWNTALEKKKEHLVTWMHPRHEQEILEAEWTSAVSGALALLQRCELSLGAGEIEICFKVSNHGSSIRRVLKDSQKFL